MINLFIFIIAVIALIVITIMYLKSVQINNTEIKYNIVTRFLIVILLTIMFLENKQQTISLNNISGNIQTYLSDAGKTLLDFIDNKTKDINDRLNNIDSKLDGIDKDIYTINDNINNTRNYIDYKTNNDKKDIINSIQNYLNSLIEKILNEKTGIGPGGVQVIW